MNCQDIKHTVLRVFVYCLYESQFRTEAYTMKERLTYIIFFHYYEAA